MINERLKLISDNSSKLHENLVVLILKSLEKRPPSNSISDEARILLRDSIFYRLNCINYHLILLINTYNAILKDMGENMFNIDEGLIKSGQNSLTYIFDDIIFNLSSLLDYFGGLVGCIYISDNKQKQKWTGCVKASRDSNNLLHKLRISKLIDFEDRTWMGQLYDYRSRLIHYKKDNTSANQQINFGGNSITVTFKVDKPEQFVNIIKHYSRSEEIEEQNIIDVAVWTIDKCLDSLIKFVQAGKLDVEDNSE